jgi:hypothetical protein
MRSSLKNSAAAGAPSQMTPPSSRPSRIDVASAVSICLGSSSGRWTIAGPTPRWETMPEKPMTTRAALTTPKSDGYRTRASAASTAS